MVWFLQGESADDASPSHSGPELCAEGKAAHPSISEFHSLHHACNEGEASRVPTVNMAAARGAVAGAERDRPGGAHQTRVLRSGP